MTLCEQLDSFEHYYTEARLALLEKLKDPGHLHAMACDRLVNNFHIHGDAGWENSPDLLETDRDEELADALVYETMRLRQKERTHRAR